MWTHSGGGRAVTVVVVVTVWHLIRYIYIYIWERAMGESDASERAVYRTICVSLSVEMASVYFSSATCRHAAAAAAAAARGGVGDDCGD